MARSIASLCLAGVLAVSIVGCSPKPEQAAQPPAAGGETAQPGDELRARADAGRQKADDTRANADRMRDAAGSGSANAAPQPPAAGQPAPAAAAAAPAAGGGAPAAAPETYGEGGATVRGRANTMRSRADRLRSSAGGGGTATEAPPPSAATRTAPLPPPPSPSDSTRTTAPAPRPAAPAQADAPAPQAAAAGRPVDANQLAALLPFMPAPWARSKVDANTLVSPVVFSQARVTYRQGSSYVRIEIVDAAGNQAALAQFTASLPRGSSKAGKDGYERRATFAGYPSWEAWENTNQHGSLNVLIANRFLVSYTGHGIESAKVLSDLAQQTDLRKLETLR